MMDEKDLLKLKEEIDEAKTKISELTGQRNYLLQELKDKHECKSVEEAEKLQGKMEKEIKELDTQIKEGIGKIEKEYSL